MGFIRSIYPGWDQAYAEQLLARFDLKAEQRIKGLSHGQRVKAVLLLILARRPRLLVLDEPTTGLDPVARHEVLADEEQTAPRHLATRRATLRNHPEGSRLILYLDSTRPTPLES